MYNSLAMLSIYCMIIIRSIDLRPSSIIGPMNKNFISINSCKINLKSWFFNILIYKSFNFSLFLFFSGFLISFINSIFPIFWILHKTPAKFYPLLFRINCFYITFGNYISAYGAVFLSFFISYENVKSWVIKSKKMSYTNFYLCRSDSPHAKRPPKRSFCVLLMKLNGCQKVYRTPTSALHFVAMSASKVLV